MSRVDKAIVTNGAALRAKYGDDFDVAAAVQPLIRADRKRGLESRLIDLSDPKTMRDLGGTAVRKPSDQRQNKAAVDAVARKLRPHYTVILGSVDVVPHQELQNPTPDDDDPAVPGDLAYACEAGYSRKPQDFRAPTRVVGRLPDATGDAKPDMLGKVIATAAGWTMRPRTAYDRYLAFSAREWQKSSQLSVRNTFGAPPDVKLSPTAGPRWQRTQLDHLSHFINCHGAPEDPHFYGQRGNDYPVAHDGQYLDGKIVEGTVAAAECCYGAQLYDAGDAHTHAGIAAVYLAGGAYAFFGSSTIAYGPADSNGQADLLCQYFLQRVLAGASIGRATLEARQRFVRDTNVLDPSDLKTLAQFSVMGDPSIQPVRPAAARAMKAVNPAGAREARRANLMAMGIALEQSRSYTTPRRSTGKKSGALIAELQGQIGLPEARVSSFGVERPPALAKVGYEVDGTPDAVHVLLAPLDTNAPGRQFRLVVASERQGELIALRDLYSR
jgi:hypothetical protein